MTTDQTQPSVGSYKWVFADSPGDWGLPGVAQVFEEGADQLSDAPVCSFEYETPYCIGSSAKTRALAAEARKKACLIAAAPDLLAALEEISGAVSSLNTRVERRGGDDVCVQRKEWVDWMIDDVLQSARAAIAKARGA